MKIVANEKCELVIEEAFSGVLFETAEGEQLGVCMRDGAYEISVGRKGVKGCAWYTASSGGVERLTKEVTIKIMRVKEKDIDEYGDTLLPEKGLEFVNGNYTHISENGIMNECTVEYNKDGAPMVFLGEDVDT